MRKIKYTTIISAIFCIAFIAAAELTDKVKAEVLSEMAQRTQVEDVIYRQTTQLPNPSITNLGSSVAIDGDTAVVGVINPSKQIASVGNGATDRAVIYRRETGNSNNWILVKELVASDGQSGDNFGISVAISGDIVVVGAARTSDGSATENGIGSDGGAYIFGRNAGGTDNWGEVKKLIDSNGSSLDGFGSRVSISGETVVVGAFGNDTEGVNAGAAFVYNRNFGGANNWGEVKKLTAGTDAQVGGKFGISVAIDGDGIVIGSQNGSNNKLVGDMGAAYIFGRNTGGANNWGEIKKIVASDGTANDGFGISVDISGETIVVGAVRIFIDKNNFANVGGGVPGAAYIFDRNQGGTNNWGEVKKLEPDPTAITNDLFGLWLSIDANTVLIGSPLEGGQGGFGAAYVFNKNQGGTDNWGLIQRIEESPLQPQANFGRAVGVSGDKLIISTEGGASNGRVYIYTLDTLPTPFDFDGDGKSDLSIFRPAPAEWWLLRSSDGGNNAFQFGQTSDTIIPADYTGDGRADIAFWRETTGEWFVLRSEDSSFYSFPFGAAGDIPVPADYDGDDIADAAIFRPSSSTWFINNSSGGTRIEGFGLSTDIPIPADYDGDKMADLAIWRPNGGTGAEFWLNRSTDGVFVVGFGTSDDKPVVGDYTGDGKDDVAFWRESTGEWFILRSEDSSFYSFPFGTSGDIPAPGDYDGDGTFDATVFRPNSTTWFTNGSTSGTIIQGFGLSTDIPLANSFVP